ncbi:ABC transporter permease [Puia dinghuensis]|uniref:ABC transporter permease n=1 Tax=Puia dinghuensis TaxID=1792502 RepID=A0A8J2U7F6_9BACT|nr:ABC transporter permease [Puia dinghuensis]GGA84126.1 ABC transporter permease [Puia dinghuensis]
MLANYFKTAWRNLWKNRVYSIINVAGLAIGMAACMVIMLFVFYEKSFDNQHTKNIYRLNEVQKFPGMVASQKVALSMFPMGQTMKAEFPGIVNYTHIRWEDKYQLTYAERRLFLPEVFEVDTAFFRMFDFRLLQGDRATALQKPNSMVLTASAARKLFGSEDAIGKTIVHYGGDTVLFRVTGVLEDVPENSQFRFDALSSFNTFIRADWSDNWGGNWLNTYFELAPNTDVAAMEKRFPAYLQRHMQGDNWKNYELFLLPLKAVHAHAADIGLDYVNYQKFDNNYTNIFTVIAFIVLVIACINFMNLSTARSAERAKEVGIRKSIGALRTQLSVQFLSETVLLALLAMVLALLLLWPAVLYVDTLSDRHLVLVFDQHRWIPLVVVLATVIVGLLSGLYPAAYLSSFQPVKVLKGLPQIGKNKSLLRNVLVVAQFASAVFLIISTVFVYRQLSFMQGKDPGFDRDQVVNITLDDISSQKFDLLKQQLSTNAAIAGVTGAMDILGSHLDQSGVEFKGDGPMRNLTATRLITDPDYLRLYKIPLIAGRDFSHEKQADGREYILNEALAQELLKDMPGKPVSYLIGRHFGFDSAGVIVGVARNFNFNSLHHTIETLFLFNMKKYGFYNLSVKLKGGKTDQAIAYIQSTWRSIFPDRPLEYQFLDEHFAEVYRADRQVSNIVGILAGLAIFISCLGLFGLASYAAEKRVKEIGIRKVMGAGVNTIVLLLSRHFVRLVLLANLLAWPLAWLAMNRWLQNYAYRVQLSWWVFAAAGVAALGIALATVSILAIKAAMASPLKALRSE